MESKIRLMEYLLKGLLFLATSPPLEGGFGGNNQLTTKHRAFADYLFGSVILHFFCVNFIN